MPSRPVWIMGGKQQRSILFPRLFDQKPKHNICQGRVHTGRWFISQQDFRAMCQRPRNSHPLPLPNRKRGRHPIQQCCNIKAHGKGFDMRWIRRAQNSLAERNITPHGQERQ
jgi:hypothetical protein